MERSRELDREALWRDLVWTADRDISLSHDPVTAPESSAVGAPYKQDGQLYIQAVDKINGNVHTFPIPEVAVRDKKYIQVFVESPDLTAREEPSKLEVLSEMGSGVVKYIRKEVEETAKGLYNAGRHVVNFGLAATFATANVNLLPHLGMLRYHFKKSNKSKLAKGEEQSGIDAEIIDDIMFGPFPPEKLSYAEDLQETNFYGYISGGFAGLGVLGLQLKYFYDDPRMLVIPAVTNGVPLVYFIAKEVYKSMRSWYDHAKEGLRKKKLHSINDRPGDYDLRLLMRTADQIMRNEVPELPEYMRPEKSR